MSIFPPLQNIEPTKETLHLYAKAMGVILRAHAAPHPQWWHISLKVKENGLSTDQVDLPDGRKLHLFMDLKTHAIQLVADGEIVRELDTASGKTGKEMGEAIIQTVSKLGLKGEYARKRFQSDEPGEYDKETAERLFNVLKVAHGIFEKHRAKLEGDVGQINFWPHGFDLSLEWFGTKEVEYKENGEVSKLPAQLNLGFSFGEPSHPKPYFYSNPWPFAESLTEEPLPEGARWFTQSWQGTILPYAELAGDPQAEARLLEYSERVYEAARPTLMA